MLAKKHVFSSDPAESTTYKTFDAEGLEQISLPIQRARERMADSINMPLIAPWFCTTTRHQVFIHGNQELPTYYVVPMLLRKLRVITRGLCNIDSESQRLLKRRDRKLLEMRLSLTNAPIHPMS